MKHSLEVPKSPVKVQVDGVLSEPLLQLAAAFFAAHRESAFA